MNVTDQETTFRQAVALHEKGQLDEAGNLYRQVLDANPYHAHALHLFGVITSIRGNPIYARRLIESSVMLNPADIDARNNLAQVLFFLGDHQATLNHCTQVLSLQPEHAHASLLSAKALNGLGRMAEALESVETFLNRHPGHIDALSLKATCLHMTGRWAEALEAYNKVLLNAPDNAEVLTNIGHAYLGLQRNDEAEASLKKALTLRPDASQTHYHLGLLHQQRREWQAALASFEKTLQLQPSHDQALIHCARVLRHLKHPPLESISLLDRALQLKPDQADVLAARGGLFMVSRRLDEALADYDQAIALQPHTAKLHTERAEILLLLERNREAADAFRHALKLGGDASYISYALASLGEGQAPAGAPQEYIADLFDSYADRFDTHLQDGLQYRVPEELIALVLDKQAVPGKSAALRVMDLGCGTGLCGPLLRPYSKYLCGVDLSPAMIEVASGKKCYDQLICKDLAEALETSAESWDLLIATDVFIYVGDLDKVFTVAQRVLKKGGSFAFSVELSDNEPLRLQATRRYAHSQRYLEQLAARHAFSIGALQPTVIRTEGGNRVNGLLVVLHR